jgi:hypothetical protein
MGKKTIKNIWVSNEVRDFIVSHNCMSFSSEKYNSTSTVYWDNCKYVETEDPNVFELIFENDILAEFVDNRRRLRDEKENNNN